jgi:hypothetical protein
MDFDVRQGARRVKAGVVRDKSRAGLNARNWLRAGAEGHSSSMATTSNAAWRRRTPESFDDTFGTRH